MDNSYNNLCVFNFGKHCYVVMKSSDKIIYFESVDGKYVMPITNFNLYDNQGKSLTLVNQHFFMNQLVNRLNIAFKKGFLSNDEDIVKYLNNLRDSSCNDINLKKLFKGSLMSEIDEKCFDRNKSEILKYLDKFRFDTFADYDNVSIFDGSLEKDSSVGIIVNEPVNDVQSEVSDILYDQIVDEPVSDVQTEVSDILSDQIVDEPVSDVQTEVSDVLSDQIVDEPVSDVRVEEDIQKPVFDLNLSALDSDKSDFFNFNGNGYVDVNHNNEQNDSFSDGSNVASFDDNFVEIDSNNSVIDDNKLVDNSDRLNQSDVFSFDNNLVSDDSKVISDSSNISYIDGVKDRMNNGYNRSLISDAIVSSDSFLSNDNVVSDKSIQNNDVADDLFNQSISNDIVDINNEELSNQIDKSGNGSKKNHLGIVLFAIFLVIVLAILSFYLYSYVF